VTLCADQKVYKRSAEARQREHSTPELLYRSENVASTKIWTAGSPDHKVARVIRLLASQEAEVSGREQRRSAVGMRLCSRETPNDGMSGELWSQTQDPRVRTWDYGLTTRAHQG
jgi:hypothetical protein